MGIHDRDYYRSEGSGFFGSWAGNGSVTLWLVGLNIACFVIQALSWTPSGSSPFTDALIFSRDDVLGGQVWRLLTYAFLHDSRYIWHIVFNMLLLWWFGRQVEEQIGSREFLVFYLVSAVVGALAYLGISFTPIGSNARVLGASGAVMATLVLAACFNPRQVLYLFFILPVPIWAFVVLAVALDLFGLLGGGDNKVATAVHLGGSAFGFLYFRLGWRMTRLFSWVRAGSRSKPRLRLYREDEGDHIKPWKPTEPAPVARPSDEHFEAQVDAILAKVSRVGMEGLSDTERQTLLRASEAIKRRRG